MLTGVLGAPSAAQTPLLPSPLDDAPARAAAPHSADTGGLGWRWDAAPQAPHALHSSAFGGGASPPDDPWLGQDKLLHAAGSFLIALSAQYVLTQKIGQRDGLAFPVAALGTFGLGLVKEIADGRRPVRPHFSTRDLVADAAGIALAGAVVALPSR